MPNPTFASLKAAASEMSPGVDRVQIYTDDSRDWTFKFADWDIDGDDTVVVFIHKRKEQYVAIVFSHVAAYRFS